jgi:hypothetical protein
MKSTLFLCLIIAASTSLRGAPADDLVSKGRAFLAARDLTNANACFASAVAANPAHAAANVFRAGTRLLVLADQPAGKALLNRLGMDATNRTVYGWEADLPRDTNGVVVAPSNMSAAELTAFIHTNVLNEIAGAAANLAVITNPNFTLTLSSNETTLSEVTVDYCDLLLVRAALRAAQFVGYTIHSWNLDVQLAAVRELGNDTEHFFSSHTNLFRFATTNDLLSARQSFSETVSFYTNASACIRGRTNVTRLFNYDSSMAERETTFRKTLTELQQSLNGPVVMSENTNLSIYLSQLFNPSNALRSFFPKIVGNAIVAGTLPDASFGGIVQGLPGYEFETLLGSGKIGNLSLPFVSGFELPRRVGNGMLEMTLNAMDGSFFAIEASENLATWTLLTTGVATQGVLTFLDATDSPAHKYYRARDLSGAIGVSGTVYDVPTGNSIAGAAVSLSLLFGPPLHQTRNSDAAGKYFVFLETSFFNPFQLDVTAPGYPPFQYQGYPDWRERHLSIPVYLAPVGYRPPNDNFAQRQPLTGTNTTVVGFNVGATIEPNEPYQGGYESSIWYTWTAPMNGAITLDTVGSSFDPVLAVFTGSSFPLSRVASGPNDWPTGTAFDLFVTGGVTYQIGIAIDGYYNENVGRLVLNLRYTTPRAPEIYYQPRDQSLAEGDFAYFDVGASGTAPLRFQWQRDGQDLPGKNSPSLYLGFVQFSDAGDYRVIVSNAVASVPSSAATLTVTLQPLQILSQPADQTVSEGEYAEFDVFASGSGPLYYQWQRNGTNLPGANDYYLYFDPVQLSDAGEYRVIVTNAYDSVTSSVASLTVTSSPPQILSQPISQMVGNGQYAEFYVDASGSPPLHYQWQRNATNVPGANDYYLYFDSVQFSDVGEYRVIVTNAFGSVTSDVATLTIVAPPANDAFANRITITGSNISVTGTNLGASAESGETDHDGYPATKSVWWTWTAPKAGTVTVDTIGSSFDTLLGVYTGTVVSGLNYVASDDQSGGNGTSRLIFSAVSGGIYQIAVDGYGGLSGSIILHLRQP